MILDIRKLIICCIVAITLLAGCASPSATNKIELRGYSLENYKILDKHVESDVCVSGVIKNDDSGLYFKLQPLRKGDEINTSFSRINVRPRKIETALTAVKDGSKQSICGVLITLSIFENCQANTCKWYALNDARMQ